MFSLGVAFGLKREDNGQRPAKKLRTELNFRKLFGYDIPEQCRPPEDIYWQRKLVLSARSIAAGKLTVEKKIWREVVWDLYENNFRVELLALDCCIFPRKLMPEVDASARDEMVLSVFPEQSVFVYSKRTRLYHGLAGIEWQDRQEYVEAFRKLLSDWPGKEALALKQMRVDNNERSVIAVERLAYPFYCKTFFEFLGRAPTTPHRFPGDPGLN